MIWTKVTDALPPDGEAVMVTFVDEITEQKYVSPKAKYFAEDECWAYFVDLIGGYSMFDEWHKITHWSPMPQPAED